MRGDASTMFALACLLSGACLTGQQPDSGDDDTGCVAAGTLVATTRGERPVESLRPGDRVLGRDPETGEVRPATVLRVATSRRNDVIALPLGGGRTLSVTPEHPIWDRDGFVPAARLREGAKLHTVVGDVHVGSPRRPPATPRIRVTVVDLEVDGHHTFFAEGVLVHNKTFDASVCVGFGEDCGSSARCCATPGLACDEATGLCGDEDGPPLLEGAACDPDAPRCAEGLGCCRRCPLEGCDPTCDPACP